jgi:hypothetical protein
MRLIEIVDRDGLSYFEAPGSVCLHELVQLHGPPGRPPGRLAARQQRLLARTSNGITVSRYRFATPVSLVRLCPYPFGRASKRSFGPASLPLSPGRARQKPPSEAPNLK